MTGPAIARPAGGRIARGWLLALAVTAFLVGWGMSGFGLIAFVFGAPVDPLAILIISAAATLVLVVALILTFRVSRGARWWVALIGSAVQIAGWIVANMLIIDIGLNP
jgi:hypothetical protein